MLLLYFFVLVLVTQALLQEDLDTVALVFNFSPHLYDYILKYSFYSFIYYKYYLKNRFND